MVFANLWVFEVPATAEAEFLRHYGANGSWAALFRLDPAYIETLLLKDSKQSGRFLTIDRWKSDRAFHAFRERYAEQYETLDRECETLTSREVSLGSFWEMSNKSAA